jgi:tripartite-type tricarboxylate transporter receptor subunit TctC
MLRLVLAAAVALAVNAPAVAEEAAWPTRAITIVGGFPGGAGTDIYTRKLGQELTAAWNVPIVSDNRTGAGGNVASDIVARAAPDGYTFLFATAGTHAINAALYKSLPFDVQRDFTHIALLGDVPNVLLVNSDKYPDVKSCQDLMAIARKNPGKLNYASTGNGASGHLAGALFGNMGKLEIVHVPYRGQGPAMTALLAGEVDFMFNQSAPSIAAVKGGKVRALGVTVSKPIPALPGVPTIADGCGLAGYESSTWYGLMGPAKLPEAIQKKMSAEVVRIIQTPEFKSWLTETQGIAPAADPSPEAFKKVHEADVKRWAEVVKLSGATVD